MRISAIDIKKQEFKKSFKGYDVGEVEAYLDTVANEMEKLFRENEELNQKLHSAEMEKENLSREIQVFRDNEKTFQKAIVKSQDLSEEVLENAKKRAELIIKEAEILSNKIRLQAKEEMMNLKQELEELRIKNENIIDDIRNYVAEKLNSIEEYSRNRKIFKMETLISGLDRDSSQKEEEDVPGKIGLSIQPGSGYSAGGYSGEGGMDETK
jgi:cell division initiation protein